VCADVTTRVHNTRSWEGGHTALLKECDHRGRKRECPLLVCMDWLQAHSRLRLAAVEHPRTFYKKDTTVRGICKCRK